MKYYVRDSSGRLQVRQYASLFETRDADEPVVKLCPHCGKEYTARQLEELLDFAGDDKMCENEECNGSVLIDPDEADRSGKDPDIS